MAKDLDTMVRFLRSVTECDAAPDAQLLQRFVREDDQKAFAAIVRRHGPMVLGVADRVLGRIEDAEDAFQATFLVLARRAKSLAKPDLLASWLYGVAYRTALEARKRRGTAIELMDVPAPESVPELEWEDMRRALDEEISRLPDRYRIPFVLCQLQGITNEEAARLIGCPLGTVHSRLARARARLRARLMRRGVTVSLGLLAPPALTAALPAQLLTLALQNVKSPGVVSATVLALTEGVLKAMLFNQLKKSASLMLIVAIFLTGTALISGAYWPARTDAQEAKQPAPPATKEEATKQPVPAPAKEEAKAKEYPADHLHYFLTSNDALAEELVGKRVRVKGVMTKVRRGKSDTTKYILHMSIEHPDSPVESLDALQFEFGQEDRKVLAELEPGDEVLVEGQCEKMTGKIPSFKDCKLITPPRTAEKDRAK